jgi:hypothetical protein
MPSCPPFNTSTQEKFFQKATGPVSFDSCESRTASISVLALKS